MLTALLFHKMLSIPVGSLLRVNRDSNFYRYWGGGDFWYMLNPGAGHCLCEVVSPQLKNRDNYKIVEILEYHVSQTFTAVTHAKRETRIPKVGDIWVSRIPLLYQPFTVDRIDPWTNQAFCQAHQIWANFTQLQDNCLFERNTLEKT